MLLLFGLVLWFRCSPLVFVTKTLRKFLSTEGSAANESKKTLGVDSFLPRLFIYLLGCFNEPLKNMFVHISFGPFLFFLFLFFFFLLIFDVFHLLFGRTQESLAGVF